MHLIKHNKFEIPQIVSNVVRGRILHLLNLPENGVMNHIRIRHPYLCFFHDSLPRPILGIPIQPTNMNQTISQMQLGLKPLIQGRRILRLLQAKTPNLIQLIIC
ncbi:hypothetical protein D3C76_961460 [compost metagenome]